MNGERFRRIIIISLGLLLVGGFAVYLLRPVQPLATVRLPDGSILRIDTVVAGKEFHFFYGSSIGGFVWEVLREKTPARLGYDLTFTAANTNGSIAILLTRYKPGNPLTDTWNGSMAISLLNKDVKEVFSTTKQVNYMTMVDNQLQITEEKIAWELPLSRQDELKIQIYCSNNFSNLQARNEIHLTAPKFLEVNRVIVPPFSK